MRASACRGFTRQTEVGIGRGWIWHPGRASRPPDGAELAPDSYSGGQVDPGQIRAFLPSGQATGLDTLRLPLFQQCENRARNREQ